VTDRVHEKLILLKRVKGSSSISDLLILMMDLLTYNDEFFVRMDQLLECA
jgi:hypothetical protein